MNLVLVFLGGGCGAICRYFISKIVPVSSDGFPFATFTANFISCIILGYLISQVLNKNLSHSYQLLLMTGFCGGFSTFSTFSAESFKLIENGQSTIAFAYMFLSIAICLGAIWMGIKIGGN